LGVFRYLKGKCHESARGVTTVGGVSYPSVSVEARQGGNTGAVLASESHVFLALDAEYRTCGGPYTGTGNEYWTNAREFRTETQTGAGAVVTVRNWEQRAPISWPNDVGSNVNAYAQQHGVDGLGRLKSVDEMSEYPSTSVYATTAYDYDARGRLKAVTQGGRRALSPTTASRG
jgi:hypothetical protein